MVEDVLVGSLVQRFEGFLGEVDVVERVCADQGGVEAFLDEVSFELFVCGGDLHVSHHADKAGHGVGRETGHAR